MKIQGRPKRKIAEDLDLRVLLVFGTRPEAVKMCPLVAELRGRAGVEVTVCVTGQHRELLDGVLSVFGIQPEYDLGVMREGQPLGELTAAVLTGLSRVLGEVRPSMVLVHGDTATAFAAALACFYLRVPIGHVEAGLRTYDMYAPYPEEFNRRATALLATFHFAPTVWARANLLREGVPSSRISVTGNTVIDALRVTVRADFSHPDLDFAKGRRLLLLTAHRRESLGAPMRAAFAAVRRVLEEREDVCLLYPVHPSPAVRQAARAAFDGCARARLVAPYDPVVFHNILSRAHLVLTDSGGVQEEAPALGVPVLLLRSKTERPEGVEAGVVRLIGTDEERVYRALSHLLTDTAAYTAMRRACALYGDGRASERIADFLCVHGA